MFVAGGPLLRVAWCGSLFAVCWLMAVVSYALLFVACWLLVLLCVVVCGRLFVVVVCRLLSVGVSCC